MLQEVGRGSTGRRTRCCTLLRRHKQHSRHLTSSAQQPLNQRQSCCRTGRGTERCMYAVKRSNNMCPCRFEAADFPPNDEALLCKWWLFLKYIFCRFVELRSKKNPTRLSPGEAAWSYYLALTAWKTGLEHGGESEWSVCHNDYKLAYQKFTRAWSRFNDDQVASMLVEYMGINDLTFNSIETFLSAVASGFQDHAVSAGQGRDAPDRNPGAAASVEKSDYEALVATTLVDDEHASTGSAGRLQAENTSPPDPVAPGGRVPQVSPSFEKLPLQERSDLMVHGRVLQPGRLQWGVPRR